MALSWNEIKKRAIEFSKEFATATRENSETQTFYNEFFNVFGISRRRIASFEEPVKKLGDKRGRIDLFWKGTLLVEQKSAGLDLVKAKQQALDYFPNLKEGELPKYILVSDFQNFELYDLEENTEQKFQLKDLHKNVNHFGFIAGYTKRKFEDQEPVNIEAAELIGDLHDKLVTNGFVGIELEQFLIRMLFCLFADDTGIFEKDIFKFYVEGRTSEDASDLGAKLQELFQVLNTPKDKRFKNLDEDLASFEYINGDLFNGFLPITSFDSEMRKSLIRCCNFDWSRISPAIFGAMFQSATDQKKRRNLGAHYTSEQNIMKIIKPLFLDELKGEFEKIKGNKTKLYEFHSKISKLKFLDPACGCGNFLIIAYRELRELELQIIRQLFNSGQQVLDVSEYVKVNINQFYGIEIEELPSKIAEVAMWLVDHQMNMKLSEEFGQYFANIPLSSHANIIHANALRMNWEDLVLKSELSYILGNPPFIGKKEQKQPQKEDVALIFKGIKGNGVLDYVTCWYIKASQYIQSTKIKVAFVSTNSISQGEQVGILWDELFNKYGIKIHFAHRSFAWNNEARGKAGVHVIIVGFATYNTDKKYIYEYEEYNSLNPQETKAINISGYLIDGSEIFIRSRNKPICDVPEIIKGSETTDNGHFMLSEQDIIFLKSKYPETNYLIRPFIGGADFINNNIRHCLWLRGAEIKVINSVPLIIDRIDKVKKFREASPKLRTREWAKYPTLFSEDRQPNNKYLFIPKISSEKRNYIPFAYIDPEYIINNTASYIENCSFYHFGILTSNMHMSWMRQVCGRLESRYIYSNNIVYNNFPFPKNPTKNQIKAVEEKAQKVLDARKSYPNSSLADLYNPLTMPPELVKAHSELDKAVDTTYGKTNFKNEKERIEFLFCLYQQYISELPEKKLKQKKG